MLVKRSEELIAQGDIAAAARSCSRAPPKRATPVRPSRWVRPTMRSVLRKLGVLGVAADASEARAWYAKAAEYGSGEATRRLEQFAQSTR